MDENLFKKLKPEEQLWQIMDLLERIDAGVRLTYRNTIQPPSVLTDKATEKEPAATKEPERREPEKQQEEQQTKEGEQNDGPSPRKPRRRAEKAERIQSVTLD